MFSLKKTRAFYKFLLSYILILLIPVVASLIVYNEIIRVVELEEKKSNLALLVKAQDTLANSLIEIDRLVLFLGNDPYVRRFAILEEPLAGYSVYYLHELGRRLSAYYERNRFTHSFYIYFRESDSIYTREGYFNASAFYRNFFHYSDMNYDEWKESFLESSHANDYFPSKPVKMGPIFINALTNIQSFPSVYRDNPTIVIWVLIDESLIKKLLSNISADGWVYIIDENDQIMASVSKSGDIHEIDTSHFVGNEGFINDKLNNQKVIVSYTTSFYRKWKYVSVIPYRTVLAKTSFISILMAVIGIAILVIGFLAAYLLALGSMKPLKELVNVIKERKPVESDAYTNEYVFINKNVRELIEKNRFLQKEMTEQLPMLRAAFFERLYKGEYISEDKIQAVLSQLAIGIKGSSFSVILVRINTHENSQYSNERLVSLFGAKAAIKNIISRKFSSNLIVHDKAEDEAVLLMCFEDSEPEGYRETTERMLNEIYNELYKNYRIQVSFAAGNIYSSLLDIWHSYREAVESMDTMRVSRDFGISWYEEHGENKSSYYYPLDMEERIMNNIKAGNRDEVSDTLSLLYKENIENRKLSADMLRFLINELCCSIIKVFIHRDLNNDENKNIIMEKVNNIKQYENFNDAFRIIKEICESICDTLNNLKKSHNKTLINNIKKYIGERHGELSLNLYTVANFFNMTEVYLSSFFKEQAGINFSDFLEEVRMKDACKLLFEKNTTVNKIAGYVGYSSVQAFSRAFKRVNGISPSDYRKSLPV